MLDASAIAQIDSTAAAMLLELRADLSTLGLTFAIAELHRGPRSLLERAGLFDGPHGVAVFEDLEDAVHHLGESCAPAPNSTDGRELNASPGPL